ncbi:lipopolysaccharide biosynthesis protein [Carboxylicivirga marina]|uniref:Oligosaccharide flippase family protein n=1 Tax=Carboxylicivirga marina TaxID=2800988 RepID=A0ABS1HLK9_9BACT|nr:oligosaccharide flippase family protein [Carboxylicivirga marina]MBK3518560.1 oligosaccharide flippase family protein [Carboxylicivirga marina]
MKQSTHKVFKTTAIYSIGNTIRKLSGIIILPLITFYTSTEEFGVWTLLETIFMLTMISSGWGVKSGFTRWFNDMADKAQKKSLFTTAIAFNYSISIVVLLIFAAALFRYSQVILKYEVSHQVLIYFLISSLFRMFQEMPYLLIKLKQRAAAQTKHSTINVLMTILFTVYFLYFKKEGLEGAFKAQMIANTLTFLGLIPIIKSHFKLSFNTPLLKEMIAYGLPLALSAILTTFLNLSDRHIINQFFNPAESGSYGLAFKVANLLDMVFISSFLTAYTFYYYQSFRNADNEKVFQSLQRYFLIIITIAGLGIVLFSKEILWVVSAGDDFYNDGIFLTPILILGLIFSGLRNFFTLPLHKHKRTKIISKILIIIGILNLVLNIVLVPPIGKIGAAWSTMLVQLIAAIWFYIEASKSESIAFDLKASLKMIILWISLVLISFILPDNIIVAIVIKLLMAGIFVGALMVLKIILPEEITEMIRIGKKVLSKK